MTVPGSARTCAIADVGTATATITITIAIRRNSSTAMVRPVIGPLGVLWSRAHYAVASGSSRISRTLDAFANRRRQCVERERFLNQCNLRPAQTPTRDLFGAVRGHEQHRDVDALRRHACRELLAVQVRHDQIRQHEIDLL